MSCPKAEIDRRRYDNEEEEDARNKIILVRSLRTGIESAPLQQIRFHRSREHITRSCFCCSFFSTILSVFDAVAAAARRERLPQRTSCPFVVIAIISSPLPLSDKSLDYKPQMSAVSRARGAPLLPSNASNDLKELPK